MSGLYQKAFRREIVTIILKDPQEKKARELRCIYCGSFLQIIYREVRVIIEGSPAVEEEITAEIKCNKCNARFEIC